MHASFQLRRPCGQARTSVIAAAHRDEPPRLPAAIFAAAVAFQLAVAPAFAASDFEAKIRAQDDARRAQAAKLEYMLEQQLNSKKALTRSKMAVRDPASSPACAN